MKLFKIIYKQENNNHWYDVRYYANTAEEAEAALLRDISHDYNGLHAFKTTIKSVEVA